MEEKLDQKYFEFLKQKDNVVKSVGHKIEIDTIHHILFDFQKDIVIWAVSKGRDAIFLDTGMGKTFIQLEWAIYL